MIRPVGRDHLLQDARGRDDAGESAGFGVGGLADEETLERIRRILAIVPGERRLLPEFGCRVHAVDPKSPGAHDLAAGLIEDALDRWAPELGCGAVEILSWTGGRLCFSLVSARGAGRVEIVHRFSGAAG